MDMSSYFYFIAWYIMRMLLCSSVRWPTDLNYITFHKNMCPCWDKRVGTFDCGLPQNIPFCQCWAIPWKSHSNNDLGVW